MTVPVRRSRRGRPPPARTPARRRFLLLAIGGVLVLGGLLAFLLLDRGAGQEKPRARPAALAGTYAARAAQFLAPVDEAMRYDVADVLEGPDEEKAALLRARLDAAGLAWAKALENTLVLEADGTARWRLKESLVGAARQVFHVVDIPPPGVDALYLGSWWQEEPGKVVVEFGFRNGQRLAWRQTSTLTLRPDGGLDVPWLRDVDVSIDEQPLLRE